MSEISVSQSLRGRSQIVSFVRQSPKPKDTQFRMILNGEKQQIDFDTSTQRMCRSILNLCNSLHET